MNHIYRYDTVSEALPAVMQDLLKYGDEVGSRNGRVKECLNAQIVISDPVRREVLSVNRKANVFAQIAETMWVLSGRNDVEWLSAYLPRAKDYSDDGETWRGGYGPRLRNWGGWPHQNSTGMVGLDQIQHVISLLRNDPLSRRAVIAIYDPATDAAPGKDIPCNDFLQFQSRGGVLHLTVTVRSNDIMWGWSGINAFEWSTLQEIVASLLGIQVGPITFNIGSLHLYEQHFAKAERIEYEYWDQYDIVPFNPGHEITTIEEVDDLFNQWFSWEDLCRHGTADLNTLHEWFYEPMIMSWAAAIAYYWQREPHWLTHLSGTALVVAVARTPASMLPEPRVASRSGAAGQGHTLATHERTGAFYEYVKNLHAVKHASYGDSWKKRGEKMSILANMARKVDRIGVGDEFDSSSDTVIDLFVYAIKYRGWLNGGTSDPEYVNIVLGQFLSETEEVIIDEKTRDTFFHNIVKDFDFYVDNIDGMGLAHKREFVDELILRLAPVARDMWCDEQHDDYRADLGQ